MIKYLNSDNVDGLEDKLLFTKDSCWQDISEDIYNEIMALGDEYKAFLDCSKTEREAISSIVSIAKSAGFKELDVATKSDKKIILSYDGVCGAVAVINNPEKINEGFLMNGAHIDVPRIDLKGKPLYEADGMAYFKTHYYGGIKKYQWVTRPLAMHGVVVKENGEHINIVIGEDDADPVFTINDLLPHLSQEQNEKKAAKVIEGEQLNILIGSIPLNFKSEDNAIKLAILNYLNQKYGIKEEDFVSAELQLVPAGKARDIGFDRSFVGAHGQDDKVCAFLGLKAILDSAEEVKDKNYLMIFFDKEEIGSKGNSGADSNILERMVHDITKLYGKSEYGNVLEALANSKFLSSDVNAGIDPEWKSVMEENNAAKIGHGVCLTKFTGVRGKAGSNEAHAEFVAEIRDAFNKEGVKWQTTELGKVDQGGGGTIAAFIAYYGMDVVDCGTALLSMHSPFEVASKADIYHTYLAYKAFYKHLNLR